MFCKKKVFLGISQNSQENACARDSFFIKKETLAQVFSCEFCEISENTFFTEHVWATASVPLNFETQITSSPTYKIKMIHSALWRQIKGEADIFSKYCLFMNKK